MEKYNKEVVLIMDTYTDYYSQLFQEFGMPVQPFDYLTIVNNIKKITQYDLIITDIFLNRSIHAGEELIKIMRSEMGKKKINIPIVIFSTAADMCSDKKIMKVNKIVLIPPGRKELEKIVQDIKKEFLT